MSTERLLLSGNEAVARASFDAGVHLGTGYPGTPSTEILENFSAIGGKAQWAPNEKVALEVALGAAFGGGRVIMTTKHVGLNVAADPLFTGAYIGVSGALVIVDADDPGMASSQNEQDNRNYAKAAGLPMLEPADAQEAYDFTRLGIELSSKFQIPVLLRMTTRVCHSQTVVNTRAADQDIPVPNYIKDIPSRVMIPAYARPAHRRLRKKLAEIKAYNEMTTINTIIKGDSKLGIITSGVSYVHAREAAPDASFMKISMSHPLPTDKIKAFAESVDRCLVIEEGDPFLFESLKAADINVEGKDQMYRFGELNVPRVQRIINNDISEEATPPKGKPPELCLGCPHRISFELLRDMGCIVSGDIGCYTLGVLPPFSAMDTCVCMGASITAGLGLRHVLPEEQARKVVSVLGDSTFMHSGPAGLIEMVYNKPATGHIVIILDNSITAMTGMQEHPGTGRKLDHSPAYQVNYEDLCKSLAIDKVLTLDPRNQKDLLEQTLKDAMDSNDTTVIICREPCILAAKKIKEFEKKNKR
ncbi:MAG: thiamine pyrophosphate-binding protein [Phycisphaerae bacterium]|nr:thiamine pyrophosphate-binding protein [Phycisphaerae bacterium]